jgi:flagellar basal-body rod protein FlgF
LVRGLYTAASGALVAQSMADNVANNLANVATSGFKQTLLQVESAPTLDIYRFQTDPGQSPSNPLPGVPVAPYVGTLGLGAQVYDTPNNFSQGPLQSTGNSLDLAIGNAPNAFFTIREPNGVRYTRNGEFVEDQNGYVRTTDGGYVLGTNGQSIQLQQQGSIAISKDGSIAQNGVSVGRLQLTQFNNLVALRPEGDNNFVDTGNAGASAASATALVQQGYLEKSNADVVRSMVDLITAERWFDANERAIGSEDDAMNQDITNVTKST